MGIYNYTQEEVFEGLAKASAEMPSGLGYVFHPSDDGLLSTRMIRSSSDGVSSVLSIAVQTVGINSKADANSRVLPAFLTSHSVAVKVDGKFVAKRQIRSSTEHAEEIFVRIGELPLYGKLELEVI